MKKLSLNKIISQNTNIKEKVAYEDFIVIDNYLVIRESFSILTIYKFSKNSKESLDFYKEIKLEKKNEVVKSLDAINPQNLFVILLSNEIIAVDIEESKQEEVKLIININKKGLGSVSPSEISIHDQCELKDSKKNIYIGFVSLSNNDLYLAYKDWNNKSYTLNCSFIKSFQDNIIHIEYKFINVNNDKNYCFICILCKMEGYTLIAEIKEEYDLKELLKVLKKESNWSLLFSENILDYKYSFYYSTFSYEQNSILILTEENKCMVWKFNKNINDSNNFLTKTEHICKIEKGEINSIRGVNLYGQRLFVTTKNYLLEYKLFSSLNAPSKKLKSTIRVIKTKIYDVPNLVYILFLTSEDIWIYQIELNEVHHVRASSNISLSSLNKNSDKESKGNVKLLKKDKITNKENEKNNEEEKENKEKEKDKKEIKSGKRNSSFLRNKENIKNKTLKIRESLNEIKDEKNDLKPGESKDKNELIQSQEINIPKCDVCGQNAKYRCALCHNFNACEMCETGDHNIRWERHKTKECKSLPKTKKIEHYINLIEYQSLWNDQRKIIVEHLRKEEFSEAIEKNYILIQDNYNILNQYEKELKILPFKDLETINKNKKNEKFLDSFLYYEDYFCNFLLLIHSFLLFKSKDEVWRLLNRLVKEMETYNFTNITNILVEENISEFNTESKKDDKKDDKNHHKKHDFTKIYLRILKILVTIAKYGNSLGEFSFYEKYLLDYVQKILEVYSKDEYINYNTYLLLGNLYVEYGFLQKGSLLYDAIINSNNNLNNKEQLNDVMLCANYNSGLVNFVIDKYEMAKQRFETALRIKKEFLKEKNDLQISQIYETISEIDIEYKNYNSALMNLQKAIESRELSNTNDLEFKLRAEELRNYIIQNSTDNKGELNSNLQFRRGENTEESENEKLVLDLIQDTSINLEHSPDIQELEKFFLFMTKLTTDQINK